MKSSIKIQYLNDKPVIEIKQYNEEEDPRDQLCQAFRQDLGEGNTIKVEFSRLPDGGVRMLLIPVTDHMI